MNLTSLKGDIYPLRDWLTSFPLMLVAIDPYTDQSSWILKTGGRLLDHFAGADIRVGWLVAADAPGCANFLEDWTDKYLVFQDPNRQVIKQLEIGSLPSLVYIRPDGQTEVANGWNPDEWRSIVKNLSDVLAWSAPLVPEAGDPVPFAGTPA